MSKKTISFALPARDTAYTVTILRDGQPYHTDLPVASDVDLLNVTVEGFGTMVFDLVIDGAVYSSLSVEFSE